MEKGADEEAKVEIGDETRGGGEGAWRGGGGAWRAGEAGERGGRAREEGGRGGGDSHQPLGGAGLAEDGVNPPAHMPVRLSSVNWNM